MGEAFPQPCGGYRQFQFLWGNVPALDVLQLSKNEGPNYDQDLHLLFAGESS